ncbi:MAG TPA: TOPRIM nucleotidyl transferase/hydrolase domain-containing protein [Candidatus Limnocylindrales bacterium]|nr:TOPRIM nucleotidyl transferase/hydrolase domain-containing protein [Candidatus Limnocylindrales bacterium]
MTSRLASVSVRGLGGLPDVELGLKPMTALIGPRGAGKSRLLAALAWLLTGDPALDGGARSPVDSKLSVTAELETDDGGSGKRTITGRPGEARRADLPPTRFLSARERISPLPEDAPLGWSDAAQAERMVERIAEERLAGMKGEILLIEEPELMLTPHQQRHLYNLLRRFVEQGNQVIYSTRSPALLDATRYDEIVRLDRTTEGMRIRRAPDQLLTELQRVHLAAEFDHERNEMFFATSVVLVEGQTERQSFPTIFNRLGYDPDALGISIVECGGKGNLILIARVLAELRIPHLIVHDSDRGRPGQSANDYIKRNAGRAPVFQLHPDFEAVAGIRSHDHKVFNAVRRFAKMPEEKIPAIFHEIADTAADLASGERQ